MISVMICERLYCPTFQQFCIRFEDEYHPFGVKDWVGLGIWQDKVVREYLESSDSSLRLADESTGLYPFMLAAAGSNPHAPADLWTVFEVLRFCPDALLDFTQIEKAQPIYLIVEHDDEMD